MGVSVCVVVLFLFCFAIKETYGTYAPVPVEAVEEN